MMSAKLTIGVTDCSKYANYSKWMLQYSHEVEVVKLGYRDNYADDIKKCRGLLLTGGEDVHPRFYGKPEHIEFCYKYDVDERRDEFELKLLDYAEANQLPVLGICRGLQIANVFYGGTLIPDIPSWKKPSHSKLPDGKDRYHPVEVMPSSWFYSLVQSKEGWINSNHHQCADDPGKGLRISASAPDGIAEALERIDKTRSFLCLVQWHPERMTDPESPFSKNIRHTFVNAALKLN